jgi:hypothetical protein
MSGGLESNESADNEGHPKEFVLAQKTESDDGYKGGVGHVELADV